MGQVRNGPPKLRKVRIFEVVVRRCPGTPGAYKYSATVPALPGCVSDGRTRKEALENVKDAIALYLSAGRGRRERDRHLVEVAV
jgi:predicted RNase H-like HicB family nuclease